jgi:hypothetical protein
MQTETITFTDIRNQVKANFDKFAATGNVFHVEVDRDEVFELYLAGFPEADGIRQSYNCNCCKSFIRQFGSVVGIDDNFKVHTLWENVDHPEYKDAAANLHNYIMARPITNRFYAPQKNCGTKTNFSEKHDCNFDHFYFQAPRALINPEPGTKQNQYRTTKQVFQRALAELTEDSVTTVLDLIAQNSLYRGTEHKAKLVEFQKEQKKAKKISDSDLDNYAWLRSAEVPAVSHIRNSAVGTLLIDLSEGMDLERAVSRYESVVAPHNYKRPKALVTPKMVEAAKEKLTELGLLESLDRRTAQETDLNINDILFTDKSSGLKDVFDEISGDTTVNPKSLTKVEEVTIDKFLSDVVPTAKSIELLLENKHFNKMFTLMTAQNEDSKHLFDWDNHFSWSYTGGITDSIKEKVKAAGGAITGELRVSLAWHNYDDLDLHMTTPYGEHIYYSNKMGYNSKGKLDIDMNTGGYMSKEPVENIIFPTADKMKKGKYVVSVNNFSKRDSHDQGFTVQLECRGEVHEYSFDKNPNDNHTDEIVVIDYDPAIGITGLSVEGSTTTKSQMKWNIGSYKFHKVKKVFLSPNFWGDNKKGNKHYMFTLENCVSDEQPRGFFNEFLAKELHDHRKVFEVLGSKVEVDADENQLSGVGFSSTQPSEFYVRVKGSFTRTLKVKV